MLSDDWNLPWSNSQAALGTECRAVSRPYEESEKERVWKLLSEAGLVDITLDEFPERIKEAKHVVMGRLSELLELTTDIQERQSAAYSLATLKKLETALWRSGRRRSCD
jgi:hypothetical protein